MGQDFEQVYEGIVTHVCVHVYINSDPNLGSIQPSVQLTNWPKYTTNTQTFLRIEANNYTTGQYHRARQCAFWNQYAPQLVAGNKRMI